MELKATIPNGKGKKDMMSLDRCLVIAALLCELELEQADISKEWRDELAQVISFLRRFKEALCGPARTQSLDDKIFQQLEKMNGGSMSILVDEVLTAISQSQNEDALRQIIKAADHRLYELWLPRALEKEAEKAAMWRERSIERDQKLAMIHAAAERETQSLAIAASRKPSLAEQIAWPDEARARIKAEYDRDSAAQQGRIREERRKEAARSKATMNDIAIAVANGEGA